MTKLYRQSTTSNTEGSPTVADWLDVSHELRTPAHAILGHVELLLSGMMGPLSSEMRASLGDIQNAGIGLLGQIEQAIKIGQELPLTSPSTPDHLIDLLERAWSFAEPFPDSGTDVPHLNRSGKSAVRPSRWLRLTAMLLHDLGATPLNFERSDHRSKLPSMCDESHSQMSKLRLECPHVDHADIKVHLKIIEEVLTMTGGTLFHEQDQLVLTWPFSTYRL